MKQISILFLLFSLCITAVFAGPYDNLIKKAGDKKSFPGSNVVVVFDSTRVEMMETGLSHNYISTGFTKCLHLMEQKGCR